jgi:hypothetical protein
MPLHLSIHSVLIKQSNNQPLRQNTHTHTHKQSPNNYNCNNYNNNINMASIDEAQKYSANPHDSNHGAHSTINKSTSAPATQGTAEAVTRALQHTDSWQPRLDRRQSWSREENKHEAHMGAIGSVSTGPGFSERQ